MQFDTTINRWHPCKNTARINASNPCSEYMFLDDSACNLSSLNLMKFVGPDGQFDVEAFRHAVDTLIMAQEIWSITPAIPPRRSRRIRTITGRWGWASPIWARC
jgi:ribonucleoside-diphosphate reductase alpha chain